MFYNLMMILFVLLILNNIRVGLKRYKIGEGIFIDSNDEYTKDEFYEFQYKYFIFTSSLWMMIGILFFIIDIENHRILFLTSSIMCIFHYTGLEKLSKKKGFIK